MRRRHLYRQQYRAMQGILPCTLYGYAWNIGVRMKKAKIPCIFALLLTATPALAAPEQGISVYPAAFFSDSRPATANDMISRLPGFTLDTGTSARGFAGTAGNVLIDGARPTAKTDDLSAGLNRIPAANVDHIDVIRGGAPGIDMQGQTVIANVILRSADSTVIIAT